MFLVNFGRWGHAGGKWFAWERVYYKGYKWTPFVKVKKRHSHRKNIEALKSMVSVQGDHGNWNYDDYMFGMFNGMELALSILENREPQYKNAPDVFLRDIKSGRVVNILGPHDPIIAE
jgi:hypothetical protein